MKTLLVLLLTLPTLSAPIKVATHHPLPNPMVLNDGTPVTTPAHWAQRREEMLAPLLDIQYGHPPVEVPATRLVSASHIQSQNNGHTQYQQLKLSTGPNQSIPITVDLYTPTDFEGPIPLILRVGPGAPIIETINQRGYAIACYHHEDLDPDTEGKNDIGPAQAAYPDQDWGSLAVWAWGASRALDHLLTLPHFDPERTVITGHSRTGKVALLAGVLDDRFQLVVPNGSGCGGAAAYKVYNNGSETLELITHPKRFQYWLHDDFRRFAHKEPELPFDQHYMRALIAPRAVLSTDALDDLWANILGTQAAWQAAQPAFDFHKAPQRNALHYREGKHDQLAEDMTVLLDYADWLFHEAPYPNGLNQPCMEDFKNKTAGK